MNDLTPTKVVDKNGKLTTVHKKTDGRSISSNTNKLPPPAADMSRMNQREVLYGQVTEILNEMYEKDKGVSMPSVNMMNTYMLASTLSMLEKHPRRLLVDMINNRSSIDREGFERWLKGMDAALSNGPVELSTRLGEAVAGIMRMQDMSRTFNVLDDVQMSRLARLSMAAAPWGMDFGLRESDYRAVYGEAIDHPDSSLMEFVIYHEDKVEQAIAAIESKAMTRLSELEELVNGDVPPSLISGTL